MLKSESVNARNFLAELKRRNVYKVAVAYAVVGWLLIQIATQVFPFFEIPNWAVRLVVLVIAIGFPFALIIAWAFEMTPGGIKRTEDVSPNEYIPQWSRRKFGFFITAIATVAAALLAYQVLRRYGHPEEKAESDAPQKSIAVLPFDNLSRDPENVYFTEGVQDEILTRLSKLTGFKVISRTSTKDFGSTPGDLPRIARELGVIHILEGSVQREADEVRVNVQLIDATTDSHLWAESYDRKTNDIFGVETEIAEAVADKLQAKLTGAQKVALAVRPTENSEAHDLYLRGRFFWNKRTVDGFKTALDYFGRAIEADPKFAAAYSGMADCYLLLPLYASTFPAAELYPKAMTAADKAIALDSSLAEPHASLGLLDSFAYDFPASLREFEEAIRLNPNYATAHQWLGDSTLLALGQFERANAEMQRALVLDPLSVVINDDLGSNLFITGHYPEAIAQLRKAIEMEPTNLYIHRDLGQALELSGDLPGAIAEYEKAVRSSDDAPLASLAAAKAKAGDTAGAREILGKLETAAKEHHVPDYQFALIYLALGEKDEAMRWLESSYQKREADLNTIRVDPGLRALHGDARFEALAEKIVPLREFTLPTSR